jgi:hypothetical protein
MVESGCQETLSPGRKDRITNARPRWSSAHDLLYIGLFLLPYTLGEMHFGKTYASQLESLPAELRHGVIEYRALKKLIRQVVDELGALGLSPDILQSVRMRSPAEGSVIVGDEEDTEVLSKGQDVAQLLRLNTDDRAPVEVVYEFHTRPDGTLEPRIRLCVISSSDADVSLGESPPPEYVPLVAADSILLDQVILQAIYFNTA